MAARGPYLEEAMYLRVPANSVKIELLQSFSIPNLLLLYEHATAHLQKFLKAVIGKDSPLSSDKSMVRSQRNPDMVSTFFCSQPMIKF